MSLSPWDSSVRVESPDGMHVAEIVEALEVAMGAPTRGTLTIDGNSKIEGCNPSMVWSDDSKYLAVPRWERDRSQRLILVNVETGEIKKFRQVYRVLELQSLVKGTLIGIDSPIHQPQDLVLPVLDR